MRASMPPFPVRRCDSMEPHCFNLRINSLRCHYGINPEASNGTKRLYSA
jgi:hypothetical protein